MSSQDYWKEHVTSSAKKIDYMDAMASANAPKRRVSKLKKRRMKLKKKSQRLKHEENLKQQPREPQISTNAMYPECKPLSKETLDLITNTVTSTKMEELIESGHLGKEHDDGPIEFKWKLVCPEPERIQHLVTQMTYRLNEGEGRCQYQIGVEDDGNPKGLDDVELMETIKTIFRLNEQLSGNIEITSIKKGIEGKVATLTVHNTKVIIHNVDKEEEEEMDLTGLIGSDRDDTHTEYIQHISDLKPTSNRKGHIALKRECGSVDILTELKELINVFEDN